MKQKRANLILVAVIGLTLISVSAGFRFYHCLFGLTTAILCCVIFETLRLGCLWSLVAMGWLSKAVAIPVYGLVTVTCGFVAIASFHAEIIESHTEALKSVEQEIFKRAEMVRREYAKHFQAEIRKLDERIDQCTQKLAWNPSSRYWQNRLEQITSARAALMAQRDSLLSTMPVSKRKEWVEYHAAVLGMQFEPLPTAQYGSVAMTAAIEELWGMNEIATKKIVSILIVVTTEFGIVLLSLLIQHSPSPATSKLDQLVEILKKRFDDDELKTFLEKCTVSLNKNGRLPSSQQLGKKQREMRKLIIDSNLSGDELMRLFREV